jgi:D-alanyl-D-alanine carboxypeptidase (penicillin-binding protein 5/6)
MTSTLLSLLLLGFSTSTIAGIQEVQLPKVPTVAAPATVNNSDALQGETASGFMVYDVTSGQEIASRSKSNPLPMASLTKLMTAHVINQHYKPEDQMVVPVGVNELIGNKVRVPAGLQISVRKLLESLLMFSAGDSAMTMAMHHSGSEDNFVLEMNKEAIAMGLNNTSFGNADGLDHYAQRSTPEDLLWLFLQTLNQPELNRALSKRHSSIIISDAEEGGTIWFSHTHQALLNDARVIAGKTGTTPQAGECLATLAEINGRQYAIIIQGSKARYDDLNKILSAL